MATAVKRPTGRDEILDAVLDAAERLFAAAGPTRVSLRAIAEEAGVNYGLVHRHFGTKDVLFDRLMQRYADRWLAELEADPDYDAALERFLGATFEGSANLRLLAWTLLSESGGDGWPADAYRRHAAIDRLPALLQQRGAPERDATIDTAAAVAFAFGWRFFNPFIRAALHLDDHDTISDAELHDALREHLHRMTAPRDR
jgi:AcrR family transcriptional regulator